MIKNKCSKLKQTEPDLENWDWYTGCPLIGSAFIDPLWHLNNKKSCFPAWSKDGIL